MHLFIFELRPLFVSSHSMFQLSSINEKCSSQSRHDWQRSSVRTTALLYGLFSLWWVSSVFPGQRKRQNCFWWRETIKALQGLKGSTKKNVFSLQMNCIESGRLRSFLLLLRYKMQIVNQVWWLIKEGQRKKIIGGERCCTFNYTIKIFRCLLWNEGWRSKEIKELKAAAFRASQNVQTWCWVFLRGRKRTFLLVCSIITHLEHQLNVWWLPDVTAYQMLMQYLPGSVGGGVLRTFSQQRC